ncbi:MAG: hypothetical protein M3R06_03115 [Chloroflexota bacterium]|nr:hypothetical protein [Chloroflexota bacterium]
MEPLIAPPILEPVELVEAKPEPIEIVEARLPYGVGFYFKVHAANRLYRVAPSRCPEQPRYWRIGVYRCATGGVVDPLETSWFSGERLSRDELGLLITSIKGDFLTWLEGDGHGDLRDWIYTDPGPVRPLLAGRQSASAASVLVAESIPALSIPAQPPEPVSV